MCKSDIVYFYFHSNMYLEVAHVKWTQPGTKEWRGNCGSTLKIHFVVVIRLHYVFSFWWEVVGVWLEQNKACIICFKIMYIYLYITVDFKFHNIMYENVLITIIWYSWMINNGISIPRCYFCLGKKSKIKCSQQMSFSAVRYNCNTQLNTTDIDYIL